MDEMNWSLPSDLEHDLERFYGVPEPSPTFAARLEEALAVHQAQLLRAETSAGPASDESLPRLPLSGFELLKKSRLWRRLAARGERKDTVNMNPKLKLAWTIALVLLVLLAISGVAYAVGKMLGYIPGVGLVEQGAPIRVLAEPVSVTRDGVTVAVSQVTITSEKTIVIFRELGVPHSAYPESEAVAGCMGTAYLRLPDGTKMDVVGNMPPVPAKVNAATFVLPCIFNTLPGTVPENWELPLRFVPAPPDLTVVPVTEILPSPTPVPAVNTPAVLENPLVITKVLEIGNSYIIMGEFRYGTTQDSTFLAGSWWVGDGIKLTDAIGQSVPYTFPNDIDSPNPSGPDVQMTWIYKVDKNFVPPLTFTHQGKVISPVGPKEQAEIEFDAGPNPQPGDQWTLNKDFKMGGYNIRLVSISFDARGGYIFQFKADPGASANAISLDIVGYTPECGGGGGDGGPFPEEFTLGVCVSDPAKLPKGKIKAVLNFQALVRKNKSFDVQWSPDMTQTGPFVTPTPQPGVCITRDKLSQLAPAPQDLTGKILMFDDQSGDIFLANLDGTQKQILEQPASWPAFLPDGTHVSYDGQDTLKMLDIATGQASDLKGVGMGGYNLQWSPKGTQVAFAGTGNDIFVSATDGSNLRQLTNNADYKTLVGWSPDETQLYITVPGLDGWILRSIDLASGGTRDLFTLENASVKAPNVTISPNGQWIAYRDRDLSSLYIVRIDGTQGHLLVDKASAGISTGFWSADGKWLAVSLLNFDTNQHTVVLIQPETCQAYLLPALHGMLEGLKLP